MIRHTFLAFGSLLLASGAAAQLTVSPGYKVFNQTVNAGVGDIALSSDNTLITGTSNFVQGFPDPFQQTLTLREFTLPGGPLSDPGFFTTSVFDPAGSAFNGFISSNGTQTLTGQTGSSDGNGLFQGRITLVNETTSAADTLDVAGNFSATSTGGDFFLNAAAGTATGVADNGNSGIYKVETSGDTITGLNLVLDTGAPSGSIGSDAAGNLVFALGGASSTITGNFNDIFYLPEADASSALTSPVSGVSTGSVLPLISFNDILVAASSFFNASRPASASAANDFVSIGDIVFDENGDLIIAVSDFYFDASFNFVGSAGAALLFDLEDDGLGGVTASFLQTIYTDATGSAGNLAYRESDGALIVANGNASSGTDVFVIAVPEPTTALMGLALGGLLLARRRGAA